MLEAINWTEVVIGICSIIITGVLVPFIRQKYKMHLTESQQKTIESIIETAVRWAKQWLQTADGAEKKKQVYEYVDRKLRESKIDMTAEDIDKMIEAIYEKVKKEAGAESIPSMSTGA